MKIEIAEPGRMTQTGSSLLSLIQNNNMPILDLLVRESIQNSLDAKKPNEKYVNVEFKIGDFNSSKLNGELEGITDSLNKEYPKGSYKYLTIRDSNTVGLTGEIDFRKVKDGNYGNLLKLIYEICKPQDADGAGGSWGLGKTIYFRIGIGLVLYYTRIMTPSGDYCSRLAASFVENEANSNSMIPVYKNMAKRGIAWWGDEIGDNITVPITDESVIKKFLEIFHIEEYIDNQTGTTIIIPYIDENHLLENNRIEYTDSVDNEYIPYWSTSVEKYLNVAIQRWYAPRLNNPKYSYGPFLRASVNGTPITFDKMEPVFKIVQCLYNRAFNIKDEDYLSNNLVETFVAPVNVKKYFEDSAVGYLAFAKLPRKVLGMEVPVNKPEPYIFLNCEITDKNSNKPLVFFVRQPGMVVSYETVSAWTSGIQSTNKNEYILGIFVLNSNNKFKVDESPVQNVEAYIRKSEMADHTSWSDWSASSFNPRIVTKIQNNLTKIIDAAYVQKEDGSNSKQNSELSKLIGDLLLPPNGFGDGASGDEKRPPNPKPSGRTSKVSFVADIGNVCYKANEMNLPLILKTLNNKKISSAAFEIQIDSERNSISLEEWENELKLETPFCISSIKIVIDTLDGQKVKKELLIDKDNLVGSIDDISFVAHKTLSNTVYRLSLTSKDEHSLHITFDTTIRLNRKDTRPKFVFEKEK